jgi:hypothetical protein
MCGSLRDHVIKNMRIAAITLVLAVLVSCDGPSSKKPGMNDGFILPVALDTTCSALPYRTGKWLSWAGYYPLYLGPRIDTIYADQGLKYSHGRPHPRSGKGESLSAQGCFIDWLDPRQFKSPDSSSLFIRVDTTRIIANEGDNFDQPEPAFKAYPVYLINRAFDTIYVGYGEYLNMIMEARTETGEWRPIEEPFNYMCGNGVGTIVLPPGYIALTSVPIYEGDLPTECRIKIGPMISSTFCASIDRHQFESQFDENGNFKDR